MTNEQDAITLVRKNKGGTIEECFGPSQVAGCEVWEVWAHDGNEYVTRFVTGGASTGSQYFASFGELCTYLNKKFETQQAEIARLSGMRHASTVRLYVAAVAFLAAVVALLSLIVRGASPNPLTLGVLASLVASGGVMFFGAWRQVSV